MVYRKTWFGYVLWVLYSIVCVILLAQAGNVWASYLAGIPYAKGFPDTIISPLAGIPRGILPYLGLLTIPAVLVLYWAVRIFAGKIAKKYVWKRHMVQLAECLVALISITGGIILRIDGARTSISMIEDEQFLLNYVSGTEYYDLAMVTTEGPVPFIAYGAAYLYVICLSAVMSFLGNKLASAIILQVILQIIGLGLAYATTRKLAGRLPACMVLLYLAYSPSCLRMLTQFSPEWFFFDLYMIGMLIVVSFVKDYCANQFVKLMAIAGAAGMGAVIGILAYLDITAVTILIFIVAIATGKKTVQEGEPVCNSVKMNVAVIITTVVACALGWGSTAGIAAYAQGMSLSEHVESWITLHIYNTQTFGYKIMYPYIWDIYVSGILVILAAFLVFEFFRSDKEQNYMLWLLVCILAAPTPMAVLGVHAYGLFSLYIWSVLAGLGLQNCVFGGKVQLMQEMIEEINFSAQEVEKTENDVSTVPTEISQTVQSVNQQNAATPDDIQQMPEAWEGQETCLHTKTVHEQNTQGLWKDEDIPDEPAPVSYEELTAEQSPKPRFIENPLPLPKKHVKKEMDYQYTVAEDDMKYDMEISENDDFDIH